MAKIYSAPEEIPLPVPDYKNYNFDAEMAKEEKYITALKAWLKEHKKPGDLVGEEITTPRGDGHARYLVASHKPFSLIHLNLGDAWRGDPIWERGINLADARKMIENAKWMSEQFGKRKKVAQD